MNCNTIILWVLCDWSAKFYFTSTNVIFYCTVKVPYSAKLTSNDFLCELFIISQNARVWFHYKQLQFYVCLWLKVAEVYQLIAVSFEHAILHMWFVNDCCLIPESCFLLIRFKQTWGSVFFTVPIQKRFSIRSAVYLVPYPEWLLMCICMLLESQGNHTVAIASSSMIQYDDEVRRRSLLGCHVLFEFHCFDESCVW